MPKFILATAALLLDRSASWAGGTHHAVHDAIHARTRSRDATRRLRSLGTHTPYPDHGPLALFRRH